jgi:hypothetical protein
MRLRIRKAHGVPREPATPRLGNQVPGSEPLAIPSPTERRETHRRTLLTSCGPASIVTSRRSTIKSITCNQGLEQAILRSKSGWLRATSATTSRRCRSIRDIRPHCSYLVPRWKSPGWLGRMSRWNHPQTRFWVSFDLMNEFHFAPR